MTGNGKNRSQRQRGIARRVLLKLGLGVAGAISPTLLAAQGARRSRRDIESPLPAQPYPAPVPRPQRVDPILFWNDTALQLDALDHSLDAKDARAPGPCASSRALALAHIVMADATAVAYPTEYQGFYVGGPRFDEHAYADVFIGAAAARILGHIYSTPAHTHLIGAQRQRFLRAFDPGALAAWNAGLEFGRNERFTSPWHWPSIREAALGSLTRGYALSRGEHDVDPFIPDQKFYGVNWRRILPLLRELPLAALGPPAPPQEHEADYLHDLEEVAELGAYRSDGPTEKQVKVGLFWAYDGARLIGTPPRLYNQIITQIAQSDRLSTPELARLLALCNLAMADAAIICWEAKYHYRLWRPVIGIPAAHGQPIPGWRPFGSPRTNPTQFLLGPDARRLTALSMLGGGERNAFGEPARNRLPYNNACFTPNFPSYPSGHATFGTAGFEMLKRVRSEREPTQRKPGQIEHAGPFVSEELNGISIDNFVNRPRPYIPIHYSSIDQMIEDNNKSRVYLGVHWNFDCEIGSRLGARVADAVYRLAYRTHRS